jgi:hypothetical protein
MPIFGIGIGYGVSNQLDTSNVEVQVPGIEAFGQGYVPLPMENLFLRPTIRFGYEKPDRKDDSQSLAIKESSLKSLLELGIVHDGLLVPTISIQAGMIRRILTLQTASPIALAGGSSLTRNEHLWNFGLTLGLGLPVLDGRIILEPYYRFVRIEKDLRQSSQVGVELSVAVPFEPTSNSASRALRN